MRVDEVDHRSTPLLVVCTTATNAIAELREFSEAGMFDKTTSLEFAEYFNGAVLVACQAYMAGAVSDINKMRGALGWSPMYSTDLHKQNSCVVNGHTQIQLIDALANCFKHHEENGFWEGPKTRASKVLKAYGIVESTAFHLHVGIGHILGESTDLRGLSRVVEGWRFMQIETLCRDHSS